MFKHVRSHSRLVVYKVLRIQPFLTGFGVCRPSSHLKEAYESILFFGFGDGLGILQPYQSSISGIRLLQHFGCRTHHLLCGVNP